jgi:hypothetical protein
MGPGMPGQPVQNIPGQANPNALKGPPKELKIDSESLPPGFAPPANRDAIMDIDQPLAMKDEIDKLKKDVAKYQTTLRTARSTEPDKALIRNGIRYRLALMCLHQNRLELSKLHDDLLRDLASAAVAPDQSTAANVKAFRQLVMQEVVRQAVPLLTTQNFYVRLHIAMLLGELNLTEENTKLALKLEPFAPACEPLVQVILATDQPEGVKVVAVNGLGRILRLGNPNVTIRTKVAQALVSELKNKDSHSWYQMRLATALATVDVDLDQGKPFVVDVLKDVLADDARTWTVRAEAARSLGRVPIPSAANPPAVVRAVAEFTLKLAKAAQQAPQTKGDESKWKGEFFKVYLAFQPLDANDLTADRKSKAGLLNNLAAGAKPAYDRIVPLVAAILNAQRLTVQQVQALEDWLNPQAAVQPARSSEAPKASPPGTGTARPSPMSSLPGPQKS